MSTKQVILLRKDLNMPAGKSAAQASHSSLSAILNLMYTETETLDNNDNLVIYRELNTVSNSALNIWLSGEQKKVCLAVNSLEELEMYYQQAQEAGLPCSYIVDNGHTVFNGVQTPTAVAIGPHWNEDIDSITSRLKLY